MSLILFRFAPLAALLAAGAATAAPTEPPPPKPPVFARVTTAKAEAAPTVIELTGEVRAREESALSFKTAGRVASRAVDVGDHVKAGQELARLSPEQQGADVAAARAGVAAAEAQLKQAEAAFARQNALFAEGFATRKAYDDAGFARDQARSGLEAARARLAAGREGLGETVLRAEAAGVITARFIEAGQAVQAAQPAFTLAQEGGRDAVFNVQETAFFKAPPGGGGVEVDLWLASDPSVKARARLRETAPAVSAQSGAVSVKLEILHPPPRMALGAAVVGRAELKGAESSVALPSSAVFALKGRPAVWIVDAGNAVALRPIDIGRHEAGLVHVVQGLAAGERVVTAGGQFLWPGRVIVPAPEGKP